MKTSSFLSTELHQNENFYEVKIFILVSETAHYFCVLVKDAIKISDLDGSFGQK
ncbi:MAG: hypothetical protein AAGI49_09765 [Bacteroidota bacterium]